jgi:hypothetical protein
MNIATFNMNKMNTMNIATLNMNKMNTVLSWQLYQSI